MKLFKRQFLFFFVLLVASHSFFAQKREPTVADTFVNKDYHYLKNQIIKSEKDSVKLKSYLHYFVQKAKRENNENELYHYYRHFHFYHSDSKHLVHSDSSIYYAKKLNDNALIGDAYYSKSVVYFFRKDYKKALDNTLTANDYIQKTNDDYLKAKIQYRIANIKLYLGFYEEAILLFQESSSYFSQENDYNNQKGYLKSLGGLAKCYTSLGKYDLATKTLKQGIEVAHEHNFDFDVHYFEKTQGINEYFKKNYKLAIQQLKQALPTIIENKDIPAEATLYFYLGKSFSAINEKQKAMAYFFKVDRILNNATFITPELRENYEILLDYYKQENNTEKQLEYVNGLLDADKVLYQNYQYLSGKIHKEYDTKSLLKEKEQLETALSNQEAKSNAYIGLAVVFAIGLGVFGWFYIKKQRLYKHLFEALMQETVKKLDVKATRKPIAKTIGINQEVVEDLLIKLGRFEEQRLTNFQISLRPIQNIFLR